MKHYYQSGLFFICSLFISGQVLAHHSLAFEFVDSGSKQIEGIVEEVWWQNPHVRYYVAVTDEDGNKVIWDTHSASPNLLRRGGWDKDLIKVGDKITMIGRPGRDDAPRLFIERVILPDGTEMNRFGYMN